MRGRNDDRRGDRDGRDRGYRGNGGNGRERSRDSQKARQPSWKGKYGRVQAAAWEQSGQNGVWYSLSLQRSYKDQYDQWQTSQSFSDGDIEDLLDALRDFRDFAAGVDAGGSHPQTRTDGDTDSQGGPY